jgi:hypothetical protein
MARSRAEQIADEIVDDRRGMWLEAICDGEGGFMEGDDVDLDRLKREIILTLERHGVK